ncbi:MAG: hypothetical protein PHC61_02320, partial [Chitinivibrionales bacterium]|nr:hypothetical protein [Chitinivibrionales bacterium]
ELDYANIGEGHFSDARGAALGGAGVAMPYGIASMVVNPALLHAYDRSEANHKFGVFAGYGRDSLFKAEIVPAGFWYCQPTIGSAGLSYRLLQQSATNNQYEINLVHSQRFFDKSLSQGPVDYGLAIRYQKTNWIAPGVLDSLYSYHRDTIKIVDSTFSDYEFNKHVRQQRLIVDLGFFQATFADNIDFGVTLKNLLGYQWNEANPYPADTIIPKKTAPIINGGTTQARVIESLDSLYYVRSYKQSQGWQDWTYKNILLGICIHKNLSNRAIIISIPADLELVSLFNRKQKTGYIFRCGAELAFPNNFFLRAGYAHAPSVYYQGLPLNMVSQFSGGAGFKTDYFALDFYFKPGEWGLAGTVEF